MKTMLADILEGFLGETRKHNEDTGQIAFDCPACAADKGLSDGDGKGNLEINYNKGMFKCWSCHEVNNMHGPVIKLLKRYGNERIIKDYLLIRPETDITIAKKDETIILTLPEGYKKLSECTPKDYKSDLALNYLYKRGITDEIIKKYEIGYTIKGKYFNRIIIPSYDSNGELTYFIARWFPKEYNKLKYLNPSAEKQEIIFNEGKINWDATIYLVEGTTDHIVIPNSIPLLGKFVSDKLLEMLHDKAKALVVIVLDDDAYEDAKLLYKKLNFGELRDRIRVCRPPEGYDPSKIFEILGNKGIIKLLKSAKKLDRFNLNDL
jgi:DNA primase